MQCHVAAVPARTNTTTANTSTTTTTTTTAPPSTPAAFRWPFEAVGVDATVLRPFGAPAPLPPRSSASLALRRAEDRPWPRRRREGDAAAMEVFDIIDGRSAPRALEARVAGINVAAVCRDAASEEELGGQRLAVVVVDEELAAHGVDLWRGVRGVLAAELGARRRRPRGLPGTAWSVRPLRPLAARGRASGVRRPPAPPRSSPPRWWPWRRPSERCARSNSAERESCLGSRCEGARRIS